MSPENKQHNLRRPFPDRQELALDKRPYQETGGPDKQWEIALRSNLVEFSIEMRATQEFAQPKNPNS
jgi:hypothetical protein